MQRKAPATYAFKNYPVPNVAAEALIGPLDFVFSPEVSGKIALSLCVILFALSSLYMLTALRPDTGNPLLLVPLVFLLGTFFFWGEVNYIFGSSILFFYAGYLFRRIYGSEPINWWLVGTALVASFACHFLSYATMLLVSLALFFAESRIALLGPFAVASVPSFGLTIWYSIERLLLKLNGPVWEFWTPHQIAGRVIAAFSPFPEFLPWIGIHSPAMKVFALLNLLVTILLTLLVPLSVWLWARGRTKYGGVLACSVVCAIAAVVFGYEFAGMISPGERMLYPAVWIGLCWLIGTSIPPRGSFLSRGLTIVMVSLLAVQIVFLQIYVGAVSNELAALYSRLRSAKSRAEFCAIYEPYAQQSYDQPHRTGLDVLLTNHASVPRLPYYLYLEDNAAAPIFQVGPLTYTGPGNNEDLCKPQ